MARFTWKGILQNGQLCNGSDHAESRQQLQEVLLGRGVAMLGCRPSFSLMQLMPQPRIDSAFLVLLFEQLGMLLGAGVPLLQALLAVKGSVGPRNMSDILEALAGDIGKGLSLASAMEKYPWLFKKYVTALVAAGEQTGSLGQVFVFLAAYLKSWGDTETRLKQSALVPLLTLGFALIIVWGVLAFVIPKFAQFLTAFSAKLPLATRCVLSLSQSVTFTNGILVMVVLALIISVCRLLAKTLYFRRGKESVVLCIPVVRNAFIYSKIVHFLAMNILFLRAGFSLKSALQNMQTITNSLAFDKALDRVVRGLDEGRSLEDAMGAVHVAFFPERLRMMVGMGEKSGDLVGMLEKTLIVYQQDLDRTFALIEAIFYPLLMVIVGGIIAFLMVSVYLPIFTAANAFNF